jgi:ABC-2 type transport system permease protein
MRLGRRRSPTLQIAATELRLYLREPSAFFFTLIFPLLLMLLFGSIWGNDPFEGEFFGYIDYSAAAFVGIVILTSGISSLTITIAAYREKGILRRFRAAPISPVTFLAGEMLSILVVSSMGVVLLLATGFLAFGMHFWGNVLEALAAFLLGTAAIAGLGFVPASLAPSARSGTVISNILYFPMLFLSGAALPRQMLPDALKTVSEVFPLTHAIRLLRGIWLGGHLTDHPVELGVLAGFVLAGAFFAARLFRWD